MINSTQDLMIKLSGEGHEALSDNIYDTEDIILLLKGVIEKLIESNDGRIELGYHSFTVSDFEESHVMVNENVKLCTKYKCVFSFTIEAAFNNSADCRMASTQTAFIGNNLSSAKQYNPYLESVSRYREILTQSYLKANSPEISLSSSDNLSIGRLEPVKIKQENMSRMVIFCETVLQDLYFRSIEKIIQKNIDTTVK